MADSIEVGEAARPRSLHWPPGLPPHLTIPDTHLFFNVEVSATRYPDKPFVVFYDTPLTFREFKRDAERIAGWLQRDAGVRKADRVLLYMQNSPQWMLAYHGILRADAVVVPVNPMNRLEELRHYVADSGASVAIVAQELLPQMQPLLAAGLRHIVVATYSDWLRVPSSVPPPAFVSEPRAALNAPGLVAWADVIEAACEPGPMAAGPDDLAVMPYTSGTTGQPKGCMHTHRSVMCTAAASVRWLGRTQDDVMLAVLPLFHVSGMVGSMNVPMLVGATCVLMARWDRETAAACIERYRVTTWQAITAMVIDFLADPRAEHHDLSSLMSIRGGGAAMPAAVSARLKALTGLTFIEGYGLTETMAGGHVNPAHRPKEQCLGLPVFDVDARIIDPATLQEVPQGESGEIVLSGPQVMQGYWRQPEATREAFRQIDGKRFLRTGDLGHIDADGYFFMTDRLKRMINASGYKVWPAEVEALMYRHEAIQEACVIAARDPRRGETVKAFVVLKPAHRGRINEQDVIDWAHSHMAPYKSPRLVEFVEALPKSGSGKVMWRELQDAQRARDGEAA